MIPHSRSLSRRSFLGATALAAVGSTMDLYAEPAEPIIDIHQHTNYHSRTNEETLIHQRKMGISKTILLPAGKEVNRPSTGNGRFNGLGGVKAGGNETVVEFAKAHPGEYYFAANEVTDLPEAKAEIEKYLKMGGLMIGEQKFCVECDSPESQLLYSIAAEWDVPILMHFLHNRYNTGIERLHKMLEKYPRTIFIGHAQTWWSNIDKNADQKVSYPKGPVTAGGITDRLLADYPNMYGDVSAGSGLLAMTRDEDHMRGFLERHQDKLLYGSDCADADGEGQGCSGALAITEIRKLSPSKEVERKILHDNANKLFRFSTAS